MRSRYSLLRLSQFVFVFWLLFLAIISFFAERAPLFYDVLAQQDVSSQYQSVIPTVRYLFEPFLGVTFTLLSRDGIWLGAFILCYFLGRVLWLTSVWRHSTPLYKRVIGAYFVNWLRFQGRSFLIIVVLISFGLLFGIKLRGLAFFQVYGMRSLLWGFYLAAFLGFMKGLINLLRFLLPGATPVPVVSYRDAGIFRFVKWIPREIALFFYLFFTLVMTNFCLISLPLPTQKIIFERGNNEYLFDFHTHTTHSDGYLSPTQKVDWYIDQGIDGAFLTDHNISSSTEGALQYIKENNLDFMVFHGEEYTYNKPYLHLLIYGIKKNIFPDQNLGNLDAELSLSFKKLIPYVKTNNGILITAHYKKSYLFNMEELRDLGLQGFEISTGYLKLGEKAIRDFCVSNKLLCVGGTDEHENRELGRFVKLRLEKPITQKKIFDQIQQGTHQVIRLELYPKKVRYEDYPPLTMEFVEALMNYFLNLDKIQLISWFVWSMILFVTLFRVVTIMKRIDEATLRRKIIISHQIRG
ncbi:MAG: hypothetical protein GY786_17785 [Proteobacteria bacterium]|nr:hypothetical protein [Pseudomonadota bacterium]